MPITISHDHIYIQTGILYIPHYSILSGLLPSAFVAKPFRRASGSATISYDTKGRLQFNVRIQSEMEPTDNSPIEWSLASV